MLRRVEKASTTFQPNFFTGKGWVHLNIGRSSYRLYKISKEEMQDIQNRQNTFPHRWTIINERTYWQFQDLFYWDNDSLQAHEVHALLTVRQQATRRRVDNAVATVVAGFTPRATHRTAIPDDVKMLVWTRDGGQCRNCGSPHELQYDHIIPLAKGGSNGQENLQILCGPCNRKKGAGLTMGESR